MEDPCNNIDWSQYLFGVADSSSKSDEALATIIEEKTETYIFFTLNSWKEKTRFEYNKTIKQVLTKVNKNKCKGLYAQWYFEDKNEKGEPTRLHVHGMISNISVTFHPYEGLCKYISGEFHRLLGKPRNAHKICADMSWARSNEAVSKYCTKYYKNFKDNAFIIFK